MNSQKAKNWYLLLTMIAVTMLMAPIQTARSADGSSESEYETSCSQDTVRQNFDRTYRTVYRDAGDGVEKKVELRYRAGILTEILVNGKPIPQSEFSKYDKVIREADADAEKIKKDLKAVSEEIEKAMQELDRVRRDVIIPEIERHRILAEQDRERLRQEMERVRVETEKVRRDVIIPEMERVRVETERVRREVIIPEIERLRIMTEEDREKFRQEMDRVRDELRINMEELRENLRTGEGFIVFGSNETITTVSESKRAEMEKKLEELEKSSGKR